MNYGTIYPALLKLEQEGAIAAEWGASENNRRAKFYTLTRAGRRLLARRRNAAGRTRPRSSPASSRRSVRMRTRSSERGAGRWRGSAASSGTGARERELADEIESHLALHIDDNLRRGLTPDEARRQARLALGGSKR